MVSSRPPPYVTLLPSVDCDLGRWLLQHYGVSYKEYPHAPIWHVITLFSMGLGKNDYPVIVRKPNLYPTIEKIFDYYEPQASPDRSLLPGDFEMRKTLMAAQHDFRFNMGTGTVQWAYFHFLPHKNLTWKSFTTGVPWYETLTVCGAYPVIKYLMFKGLNLSPKVAETGLAAVRAGFDKVDALLADGRRFLYADRLTIADLAFAASAAPMVLANGYQGHLPTIDKVPKTMSSVMEELRARPAGKYVQQMYDEFRIPLPGFKTPN